MMRRGLTMKIGPMVKAFAISTRRLAGRAPDWQYYRSAKTKVLGSRAKGTW